MNRNNLNEGYNWYDFGEDGKKVYDFADYDGIVVSEVDGMHYVKAGMSYYAGLIYIDTDNDGAWDEGELAIDGDWRTGKCTGMTLTGPARRVFDGEIEGYVPRYSTI